MALTPKTRLGRYEIRSKLGSGGMGEVYLAEDLELERPAALKLLPEDVTADEQRMKRFTQEAKAASALNHPNILTVYEIGTADSTRFIATEYVRGETLRARMARERLSLRETFEIALQIAAALAAAHEAHIVHRDIKPENIMLRPDGLAKVLDFGLAKLTEKKRGATVPDTEAPTRALVNTAPGVVMGTAAYMSPEQARGLETDERTDIWSFGVVLYEMLAGHIPFEGATANDQIASILKSEPAPLSASAPETPPELLRIVRKALQKQREERYQTIKDLLLDLKSLKRELEFAEEIERSTAPTVIANDSAIPSGAGRAISTASGMSGGGTADQPRHPTSSAEYVVGEIRRHKTGAFVIVALVVLAGAGFGIYRYTRQARPAAHFRNIKLTRITSEGNVKNVAVSPDGKYIAYSLLENGKPSLWTKHLATDSRVQIAAPVAAAVLNPQFFSHDGGYVFYTQFDEQNSLGALFQIPVLGGTPKKILGDVPNPVALSRDGEQVAFERFHSGAPSQYELWLAKSDGTGERMLCVVSDPSWFGGGVAWSPDARTIAAGYGDQDGGEHMTVAAVDVADGKLKPITSQRWFNVGHMAWLGDGSGLIVTGLEDMSGTSQIWEVAYPDGAARRITNDLNSYSAQSLSLTDDSRVLVDLQEQSASAIWIAPDADPKHARAITGRRNVLDGTFGLDWTPDGRVVFSSNAGGSGRLWIAGAEGGSPVPLTGGESAAIGAPLVSPDGRLIFFESLRSKTWQVWRMDSDGSHAKQVTEGSGVSGYSLTPDGKSVIYVPFTGDIWRVSIDGLTPGKLHDAKGEGEAQISPDGKFLAYGSLNEQAKRVEIVVVTLDGGAPVATFDLPVTVSNRFHWSPDSRALVYIDTQGEVSNLWRQPFRGGKSSRITDFTSDLIYDFAYARDGHTLALSRGNTTRDAVMISDVQ